MPSKPKPPSRVTSFTARRIKLLAIRLLLISTLVSGMSSCERDLRIEIDEANPPTFKLTGSGQLVFLHIMEVPLGGRPSFGDKKLWEIRPNTSERIWKLPKITYGKVPEGFTQVIPENGEPPPLVEGKMYEVGGPASGANGGTMWFTIRDGKSVRVPKTDGTLDR